MTERERARIRQLAPYMWRIPPRLDKLLIQILLVRKAYAGQDVPLTAYKENLETELNKLEQEGRAVAQVATLIRGLLKDAEVDDLVAIHRILDEAANGEGSVGDE